MTGQGEHNVVTATCLRQITAGFSAPPAPTPAQQPAMAADICLACLYDTGEHSVTCALEESRRQRARADRAQALLGKAADEDDANGVCEAVEKGADANAAVFSLWGGNMVLNDDDTMGLWTAACVAARPNRFPGVVVQLMSKTPKGASHD